jgi:7,8-dihydropterin-6-yl-methyl-4-(beta-D-ribofuranosyl)aminobenzene 5'-phosphate synthase
MIFRRKSLSLRILITLTVFLAGCGSPLLKAENPLIKADTDVPQPEISPTSPPTQVLSDIDPTQQEPETEEERSPDMITITLVYDNYPYRSGLRTDWGFSAFITYQDQNILFDTGAAGNLLLKNMTALDIKPAQIQNIILSHEHADHTGGLQSLVSAGADPKVYIPPSFSSEFKNYYRSRVELIEVIPGMKIIDRMYSIGEMPGPPPEQALVIDTTKGLVVITGCAHPGIEDIVLKAKQEFKEDIYLVLGGFHLGNATANEVDEIIKEFNRIGVKYVAPCHCTGEDTISIFRNAYGEDFIQVGVGKVIEIEN